jgi:hypothetical protein
MLYPFPPMPMRWTHLLMRMLVSLITTKDVPMPKSIEFEVERVEPVKNDQGKIITFVIDGIARQGRMSKGLRVFMDHDSWIKVACALQVRKDE